MFDIQLNIFPLNIFPHGSLAGSVTTTVLVGIWVAALLNLRFGWALSGLVVSGYIVPLMLIKPWAAAVIVFEGVLTYLIVVCLFKYLSRLGGWNSVFGRDRFFALLLVSVLVRILLDGWLLPITGEMLNSRLGIQFDYRNHLHSFGLIIVALIANQFWKPGLRRGFWPFTTNVGLTFLLVRYGLMEFTNFSMSNVGYMYEDIAASMLASPKSYIILLTTAFLASHMNLKYGWEFSGILIPSLLSLLWYQPLKIATSFVETFVILVAAKFLLQLPVFQKTTIEGARKLLVFFNISYIYKFLLAYGILWLMPEQKITDYYGFGYLLPSLLAIKMFDKEIAAKITRTTIQTSFMAIVIASGVGFALTLLPMLRTVPPLPEQGVSPTILHIQDTRIMDLIRQEKIALYRQLTQTTSITPLPLEIADFSEGIRYLLDYAEGKKQESLLRAQLALQEVNYQINVVANRYIYLSETEPRRNWGTYILDTGTPSHLLVEVPAPLEENDTMEAGTRMFLMMEGKALAIAGTAYREQTRDASLQSLSSPYSLFYAFHREVARNDVVQVRGYTLQTLKMLRGVRQTGTDSLSINPPGSLWVKASLPPGLLPGQLRSQIGAFEIEWGNTPTINILREATRSGFAELYLNQSDMMKLFLKPISAQSDVPIQTYEQRVDGYLQDWLLSGKARLAEKGSADYVSPKLEELLYFDEEILTPLLQIVGEEYHDGKWSPVGTEQLHRISAAADVMGYQLIRYHYQVTGQNYILLMEHEKPETKRHWGTYVIRLGHAEGYEIQIPRPLYDLNVFEYGVALFERLQARALLIGGTHKDANPDGSADIIRMQNIRNLFHLVHQVLLRESREMPMLVLQARARGIDENRPIAEADVLLAFRDTSQDSEPLNLLEQRLIDTLHEDGITTRLVDGSPETAGYEVGELPQASYIEQAQNKNLAVLWLSPFIRARHRQQTENWWQETQFKTTGIPTQQGYLHPYLTQKAVWNTSAVVPEDLYTLISNYRTHEDILLLRSLLERWPAYRFERFIDSNTRQSFLLVFSGRSHLLLVANLLPGDENKIYSIGDESGKEKTITQFLDSRAAWLQYR